MYGEQSDRAQVRELVLVRHLQPLRHVVDQPGRRDQAGDLVGAVLLGAEERVREEDLVEVRIREPVVERQQVVQQRGPAPPVAEDEQRGPHRDLGEPGVEGLRLLAQDTASSARSPPSGSPPAASSGKSTANRFSRRISHQSRNVTPHRLVKKVFQSQTRVASRFVRPPTCRRVASFSTIVATCVHPPGAFTKPPLPRPRNANPPDPPGRPSIHSLFLHPADQPQIHGKIDPERLLPPALPPAFAGTGRSFLVEVASHTQPTSELSKSPSDRRQPPDASGCGGLPPPSPAPGTFRSPSRRDFSPETIQYSGFANSRPSSPERTSAFFNTPLRVGSSTRIRRYSSRP